MSRFSDAILAMQYDIPFALATGNKFIEEGMETAIEALEVCEDLVYCKNCHYAKHDSDKPTLWRCSNSNWYKTDDDFCSKGEKREEE